MTATKKKQEALSRRASGPLSKPVSTCTVGALEAALLSKVPAADAEDWDRTGMTVGDPGRWRSTPRRKPCGRQPRAAPTCW